MQDYQREFITYALSCGALKFGEFLLKSGRISPYFFNTGLFDTGVKLGQLGQCYAQALLQSKLPFDVLYGPAYKGIPLVASTAIAYAQLSGSDVPYVFNRKEAKDHGEGGLLVGAELCGKVVIVDDVITAGTSVRESVDIIRSVGATPAGVVCALDRLEKGQHEVSAIQQVVLDYDMPVFTIISLETIIQYLAETGGNKEIAAIHAYQKQYGV